MPLISLSSYKNPAAEVIPSSMLLHMDGADGSSTFTDEKGRVFTVSAGGVVQIKSAIKKYGTGSAYFNGSGYISTPNTADITRLGTNFFSIDFMVYPLSQFGPQYLVCKGQGLLLFLDGGQLILKASSNNGSSFFMNSGLGALVNNAWNHVALLKNKYGYTVGVNGRNRTLPVTGGATQDGNAPLVFGGYAPTAGAAQSSGFSGYMDEIRLVLGIDAYPTMKDYLDIYPVPTEAYTA